MQDDSNAISDSPPRRSSALVSRRFESLCLRTLAGLSLGFALGAMLANEYFPRFQEQTLKLLHWQIVDSKELRETAFVVGYKLFNRVEGLAWFVFAGLAARRYLRFQKSAIEPVYALAFLFFGISDFVEAIHYPAWLGIWKLYGLLIVLYCRSYMLRVHYLDSKVY